VPQKVCDYNYATELFYVTSIFKKCEEVVKKISIRVTKDDIVILRARALVNRFHRLRARARAKDGAAHLNSLYTGKRLVIS